MQKLLWLMAFLALFSLSSIVYAIDPVSITVDLPVNGTEYFDPFPSNISVTVNDTTVYCDYFLENSTVIRMTNLTDSNLTFVNATPVSLIALSRADNSPLRNLTVKCTNTSSYWSNSSATAGITYFRINERASNTTTFTGDTITSLKTYPVSPFVNITASESTSKCYFQFNKNTTNFAMKNITTTHTTFTNNSVFVVTDTAYGAYDNITYLCDDAFGNRSVSSVIPFRVDTTAPTVGNVTYTISNNTHVYGGTENGNKVEFKFDVTDNSPDWAFIAVTLPDLSVTTKNATTVNSTQRRQYSVNLTNTELTQNGKYIFTVKGNDSAGNIAEGTNQTLIINHLIANEYNFIGIYSNDTLATVAGYTNNITSVSIFTNRLGQKNFTTFVVGLSTNGVVRLNETRNTTTILVNENIVLIRNYSQTWILENETLYVGWNMVPIKNTTTLGYANSFTTLAYQDANGVTNVANVTYTSWFNNTLNKFCSNKPTWNITSCANVANNTNRLREGDGLWILVNSSTLFNGALLGVG